MEIDNMQLFIGSRTSSPPVYSTVPQPLSLLKTPVLKMRKNAKNKCFMNQLLKQFISTSAIRVQHPTCTQLDMMQSSLKKHDCVCETNLHMIPTYDVSKTELEVFHILGLLFQLFLSVTLLVCRNVFMPVFVCVRAFAYATSVQIRYSFHPQTRGFKTS
jgi:hypothetical protein